MSNFNKLTSAGKATAFI